MSCPTCGHENPVDASFCEECGASLQPTCPACGSEVSLTARFCQACGAALAPVAARFIAPAPSGALSAAPPQSHTPPHLAEKILTSRGALEGERKQVTVLFADLKGSMELLADRDPEEARTILDGVLQRMMEAVHRYEGTVNQVMGDGIMALFGAPIAHEDHAVRACYAALGMQQAVRGYAEELQRRHGLFVHIRVGLNSGEVVVRSIGSDLHMDYSAVGQTTSLAARMEQMAAPGSTLMAPATVQLVEGYVQVRPLGPIQVKGIDEPLEAYEILGAGRARTRLQAAAVRGLTRFVGRDTEMETLRHAVERAAAGHGQAAAIVGEPGVGKSRLAYELVHSHRTHGWLVLEAGSISYGRATPYLPVTDLLKAYFRIEPQDDERGIREKVAGKVLTLDEALRPYLPACLTLLAVSTDDPAWRELEPAQRSQQTLEAVRRLLLRESQVQPVLLVFEDLHWIDGETQALLDGLVESIPSARVLLLVNYRPEYRHSWGSKTYYAQVRLDPLAPESADELLGALLGDDAGLEPLKALLVERTEGNPFFLEESVRTLIETVALVGERGGYRLVRPVESTQVPATVQAMLAARIDRLPPEDKRLLQSAAVIGKDVPYVLLRAIVEEPEGQLRGRLVHLQGAEFLYEASLFPEVEYTFKHALTHEVAYGSLLQERRRALHARIVEAMERVYIGRLVDHVERLAHHSVRGEQWAKAVAYLQEASAKAAAQSAYAEAARLLEQALEAQERLDPTDRAARCDLLLALAKALGPAGEPQKAAEEVAPAAFALAEELGDRGRLARCSAVGAESVMRYGAGALGGSPVYRMWGEREDQYAEPGTPQRVQADLYLWSTRFRAGQWAEARAGVARSLELARSLDDPELLFKAVSPVMQPGFSSARHQPEALRLAEEISRRNREGVSVGALASALGSAQMVYLEWGQRPRAEELWRELEALASRTQDPTVLLWPLECEAIRANLEGDLEATVEAGQRLVARGAELGSAVAGQFAAENLTFWPLLYLGRAEEALGGLGAAQRMAGLRGTTVRAGRTGLSLAHMGRIDEAHSELRDALQRLNVSAGDDEMFSSILSDLLHTAVMVEDREAAALLAHRLAGVTAVGYSRHTLTNVARALGRAAALLGDPAAARANYERALEWATAIRHRPEIALTRLEIAELLLSEFRVPGSEFKVRARGPKRGTRSAELGTAAEHLDFAIAEFRAMKMQPALERALRQKSLLPA